MADVIIIAVLAVIVIAAARYIYKAKKSGAKCIGCSARNCSCCSSGSSTCDCGCGGTKE